MQIILSPVSLDLNLEFSWNAEGEIIQSRRFMHFWRKCVKFVVYIKCVDLPIAFRSHDMSKFFTSA